jgi:hypothetical protein
MPSYRQAGHVFPNEGCLLLNWFSNADLFRKGKYEVFETLKHLSGDFPKLQRARKFLNDQFEYKGGLRQSIRPGGLRKVRWRTALSPQ